MNARQKVGALVVAAVLLAGRALAQPTPADSSNHLSTHDWDFSLATLGYLVPNDISYGSPTFTADHSWLHLEGRYNYENQQTGSLWAGYNYNAGHNLLLSVTPMVGVVFGNTTGIAPGYELSLAYKKIDLSSQGEYVFDTGNRSNSFYYSWNEATFSLTDWCNVGLVAQRTKAYQTPLDVQRGFSVGFSYRSLNYTTYIFNAGWTDPTVVLALSFKL